MNSIMIIHPYKVEGIWVFDDPNVGLVREPFIDDANGLIDIMTKEISDAENGFNLLFSGAKFPGYQLELTWDREEFGGNWYYSKALDKEAWLCPALFKYFDETPQELYGQFKSK
ncbi:DUF6717 family protein [Microbulbifer sp. SSSA002]|uniref:DUF6717 family protein n=1 Tax=unclassified Microbulbifer TaxID=2619833 RepID=UPI004039B2BE